MVAEELPARSRILIIGSAGFIGSHLSTLLAEQGHEIYGLDLREPAEEFGVSKLFAGDVRRKADLLRAMDGVDTVINLSAIHFDFGHEDDEYFETNDRGMQVLLDAMTEANVHQLIFTSSIAVYGDLEKWADEETTPKPDTPYGASKLAAEQRVRQWAADDPNRRVAIVRPCAVYGERNVSNMMNLIKQIYSGVFILFGSGRNLKATAYVGNLVDAIAMQRDQLSPGVVMVNYADKPDLNVSEIVSIIRKALGKNPKPVKLPLWLGVIAAIPFEIVSRATGMNLSVSIARVKKLAKPSQVKADRIRDAGFQQQVTSAEGLQRMVRHFLSKS